MTALLDILAEARERKLLGSAPLEDHVANGQGFVAVSTPLLAAAGTGPLVVDLGSGGGVPACVLIDQWPRARFALIERGERRATFLQWMVEQLGSQDRVSVVMAEAEDAARLVAWDGRAALVTARSFAPPAVTAECACRFLNVGGHLVVSEPPDRPARWDASALASTGLVPRDRVVAGGGTFQILELVARPADRYPRKAGTPRKRPLWV